jgi:beta-mannosidase
VRFAAECLAFANMPDDDAEADAWIPRDGGADWDFADVRDRYLALLYGVDPGALRHTDPARYRALSRAVSGEVMAEVMGEWRRAASPCGGGLVLWLRDLAPGSGWGVLDHRGLPKAAYHHLRRVLAPVAVWTTDEQLNGIAVHVANDRPEPLRARLRVALYADGERRVEEAAEDLLLPGGGNAERDVEAMLGHFVDASWAYRFGPPAQDVIVAGLHDADGRLLSQALRFPAGRPRGTEPAERLGLTATLRPRDDGDADLEVAARRVVHGLRVHAPGFAPDDDAFGVEPGGSRTVRLRRTGAAGGPPPGVSLTALNLDGRVDAR